MPQGKDIRAKSGALRPKQRKALEGLAAGKTIGQAARDAGYSPTTADRGLAGILTNPATIEAFREVMKGCFSFEEFAERVRKGCDATETRLSPSVLTRIRKKGPGDEIIEREKHETPQAVEVIAWGERRKFLELWARLSGYMRDEVKVKVAGDDELVRRLTAARDRQAKHPRPNGHAAGSSD